MAPGKFEFLHDIMTLSNFKAGSEVVSCKLIADNYVETVKWLMNVLVLFCFI